MLIPKGVEVPAKECEELFLRIVQLFMKVFDGGAKIFGFPDCVVLGVELVHCGEEGDHAVDDCVPSGDVLFLGLSGVEDGAPVVVLAVTCKNCFHVPDEPVVGLPGGVFVVAVGDQEVKTAEVMGDRGEVAIPVFPGVAKHCVGDVFVI